MNLPATLTTWSVQLAINLSFTSAGTVALTIPPGTSIDLFANSTTTVPSLGPLPLSGTAMLLALAGYTMLRRKQSGEGLPRPPL